MFLHRRQDKYPRAPDSASPNGELREVIKTACEDHEASLTDFTVLSSAKDPYRIDTDANRRDGAWLAKQLTRFYGQTRTAHWRGLHYAIVAAGNVRKPNGEVYRNTEDDWIWLSEKAGKPARWLGYISFDRIIDQRNAPPIIHRRPKVAPGAHLFIGLNVDIPDADDIKPLPHAVGFVARQAFQFCIFGEKSSLEEILLPIAVEFEADLYLPTGEISDTLVYRIARDANADGRRLVMFTLADCDPSGWQMSVSIGRKLQAFRDLLFPDLRVEMVPVALTPEQVGELGLPSTPLKEEEKRGDRWREEFGVEQTEIDALTTPEQQRQGTLADIVRQAFDVYIDSTLSERVNDAEAEWIVDAQEAIDEQIDADTLEEIRAEAATKLEQLREQIDEINEQLNLVAGDHFTLPPIEVPEPEVDLEDGRQALVLFDDDWVEATKKLIERKSYGK